MNPEQNPNTPVNNPNVAPQPAPAAPAPTSSIVPAPKKKFPTWLKVLLGIIAAFAILGAAIIIFVTMAAAAPEKVSNQGMDNIQAGNTSEFYSMTSAAFKENTSESQLTSIFAGISDPLKGEEKIVGKYVGTSNGQNSASFVYQVENDGDKFIRITLVEVDGEWKINGFLTSETKLEADPSKSN